MHLFGTDPRDMTYQQFIDCKSWAKEYWERDANKMA